MSDATGVQPVGSTGPAAPPPEAVALPPPTPEETSAFDAAMEAAAMEANGSGTFVSAPLPTRPVPPDAAVPAGLGTAFPDGLSGAEPYGVGYSFGLQADEEAEAAEADEPAPTEAPDATSTSEADEVEPEPVPEPGPMGAQREWREASVASLSEVPLPEPDPLAASEGQVMASQVQGILAREELSVGEEFQVLRLVMDLQVQDPNQFSALMSSFSPSQVDRLASIRNAGRLPGDAMAELDRVASEGLGPELGRYAATLEPSELSELLVSVQDTPAMLDAALAETPVENVTEAVGSDLPSLPALWEAAAQEGVGLAARANLFQAGANLLERLPDETFPAVLQQRLQLVDGMSRVLGTDPVGITRTLAPPDGGTYPGTDLTQRALSTFFAETLRFTETVNVGGDSTSPAFADGSTAMSRLVGIADRFRLDVQAESPQDRGYLYGFFAGSIYRGVETYFAERGDALEREKEDSREFFGLLVDVLTSAMPTGRGLVVSRAGDEIPVDAYLADLRANVNAGLPGFLATFEGLQPRRGGQPDEQGMFDQGWQDAQGVP